MCQRTAFTQLFFYASAVLCGLVASSDARATCLQPDGDPLWTYPADGDTDVPLNAVLLVLRPTSWDEAEVTLDGEPLTRAEAPFESYVLGKLAPQTTYTVSITVPYGTFTAPGPSTTTLEFTTGKDGAEVPEQAPQIASIEGWQAEFEDELPCSALLYMDSCFDTGPPRALQITTAPGAEAPVLWRIEWTYFEHQRFAMLPASCGEPMALDYGFLPPYVLHAVYANGKTLESDPFEPEPSVTPMDDAQAGDAGPAAAGPTPSSEAAADAAVSEPSRARNAAPVEDEDEDEDEDLGCMAAAHAGRSAAPLAFAWGWLLVRALTNRRRRVS